MTTDENDFEINPEEDEVLRRLFGGFIDSLEEQIRTPSDDIDELLSEVADGSHSLEKGSQAVGVALSLYHLLYHNSFNLWRDKNVHDTSNLELDPNQPLDPKDFDYPSQIGISAMFSFYDDIAPDSPTLHIPYPGVGVSPEERENFQGASIHNCALMEILFLTHTRNYLIEHKEDLPTKESSPDTQLVWLANFIHELLHFMFESGYGTAVHQISIIGDDENGEEKE